jgi:uncharacterized membrane protein
MKRFINVIIWLLHKYSVKMFTIKSTLGSNIVGDTLQPFYVQNACFWGSNMIYSNQNDA